MPWDPKTCVYGTIENGMYRIYSRDSQHSKCPFTLYHIILLYSVVYYMNVLIAVVWSLRSAKTVQLFFGYCNFGETLSLLPIFVVVIVAVFMIVYITRIAHSSTHNSVRKFQHKYPSENALILLSFRFTLTFRKSLGLMVNMREN